MPTADYTSARVAARSPAPALPRAAVRSKHAGWRAPTPDARFDDALALFELGRWPQAFELLCELADAAHPQAARLALLMARRGSALFGGHYGASADRRRRWAASADNPACARVVKLVDTADLKSAA